MEDEYKLCNGCLEIKPHSEFSQRKTNRGLWVPKSRCKPCAVVAVQTPKRAPSDSIYMKTYQDYLAEANTHHTDKYFKRSVRI